MFVVSFSTPNLLTASSGSSPSFTMTAGKPQTPHKLSLFSGRFTASTSSGLLGLYKTTATANLSPFMLIV